MGSDLSIENDPSILLDSVARKAYALGLEAICCGHS